MSFVGGNKKQQVENIKRIAKGLKNDLDNNRIAPSSYKYLIDSFNRDLEALGVSDRV